jgi:hypothetical protein
MKHQKLEIQARVADAPRLWIKEREKVCMQNVECSISIVLFNHTGDVDFACSYSILDK